MYEYVVDVYEKCLQVVVFDAHVTTLYCEIVHSSTTSVLLAFNVNTICYSVMLIIALMHPITFILAFNKID